MGSRQAAGGAPAEKEPAVPVSFRLSTYWKLGKGQAGVTYLDSRRLALSEVLGLLWPNLADDACTVTQYGAVTTIVIDWAKVPVEVRNPFAFGVKR